MVTAGFAFSASRPDPSALARVGRLATPRGAVETPALVVTGPQAAVLSLEPPELVALGAQAVRCSTYHLYLRPGADAVAQAGGLHAFMGWTGPIFADSASLQVFSLSAGSERLSRETLGALADDLPRAHRRSVAPTSSQARLLRLDDDGVTFRSYVDGSTHRLTPELSLAVQESLGADVLTAFDQPTAPAHDEAQTARALERSRRWAERALAVTRRADTALYGVVGGGAFRAWRERSAATVGALPFDGFVVGGTVGLTGPRLERMLAWTVAALPEDRPRHLSGVGEPADLFRCVERGIDTIDSELPTRQARRGVLMTADGPLTITRAAYREDDGPVDPACGCPTCQTFSRAYLRHLFTAEELLAYTLAATHNLAFVLGLMARMRAALTAGGLGGLDALKADVLARYGGRPVPRR